MPARAVAAIFFFLFAGSAAAAQVTPVQKVTELLKKLQAQVTEEGQQEAKQYDKYSCFCKKQADEKQYNIEESNKTVEELNAKIQKLGDEIAELDSTINTLGTTISDKEAEHKSLAGKRVAAKKAFVAAKRDLLESIAAVEGAIETLTEAKGEMTDAKLTSMLVQVRDVVQKFAPAKVGLLASSKKPGEPAKYQYHSNDIIASLQEVSALFKGRLKKIEKDEFNSKAESEASSNGLSNEIKFAAQDKADKEASSEAKAAQKAEAESDLAQETKDMTADQKFLGVLTADCKEKAELFDQRSKSRANEMSTIQKALEELATGEAKYGANKKLVGLQVVTPHLQQVTRELVDEAPTSFVQLHRASSAEAAEAVSKAQAFLATRSTRLQSAILTAAAIKVEASKDHFVKVRALLKDIISKLEEAASAEADQKSGCDKGVAMAVDARDSASSAIEKGAAKIALLEASIADLKSEIETLAAKIAENKKALSEANELRNGQSEQNSKIIADAEEGKDAVELAIKVLTDYYKSSSSASLLQDNEAAEPPTGLAAAATADRDGNQFGDVKPEVFDEEYKGKQTEAKGIIGILEVILADFSRTIDATKDDEDDMIAKYNKFKAENEADTKTAEEDTETKSTSLKVKESDKLSEETDKKAEEKKLKYALDTLDSLKADCVNAGEEFANRKQKRSEEIAALKQAMQILVDWQA